MKIAFHHPAARRGYALPSALEQQNRLFKVFTDCYPRQWIRFSTKQLDNLSMSKFKLYQSVMKRYCNNLPDDKIIDLGLSGYFYNFLRSSKKDYIEQLKITIKISELISEEMKNYSQEFDWVYSFALSAFPCKKIMGNKEIILDQMHIPLISLINVLKKEEKINGDWFEESINPYKGSEDFILNLEKNDLDSADLILAPSEFVKQTLMNHYNFSENEIILNPYLAPSWLYDYPTSLTQEKSDRNYSNEKLNILFVGEVGIRKGAHILLQALDKLDPQKYESRLVGSIKLSSQKVKEYSDKCIFMGKLSKPELAKQYQWADVFVFPSLGEGSAGVTYEAMAFGLPIITTFSSGSHVRNDIDGYIIPEGDVDALISRINTYINNKSLLTEHSVNSWNRIKDFSHDETSLRLEETFSKIGVA